MRRNGIAGGAVNGIVATLSALLMTVIFGPTPIAHAVSGSMDDWIDAVCLPNDGVFETTTRFAIGGKTCVPRSGVGYVNFDIFGSEADMNQILGLSRSNYSAKTTFDGHPMAIWIPASRDGSELAPLKQFGFNVSRQPSRPQSSPTGGSSNAVPGLAQGAKQGQACSNYRTFIFGVSQNGSFLACIPDGNGGGNWVNSSPVVGVRQIGSSCDPGASQAAQSPDGRGLVCGDSGWVPGP